MLAGTLLALAISVRRASTLTEEFRCARLVADCFGGWPFARLASLRAPGLEANVFFRPIGPPAVAAALDSDGGLCGTAQLMKVELSRATGAESAGRVVAFTQSVSVAAAARRRGVGRALVAFCEEEAREAWAADGVDEAWLAVATENEAARALYDSLGYQSCGEARGNLLLRKRLATGAASAGEGSQGIAEYSTRFCTSLCRRSQRTRLAHRRVRGCRCRRRRFRRRPPRASERWRRLVAAAVQFGRAGALLGGAIGGAYSRRSRRNLA